MYVELGAQDRDLSYVKVSWVPKKYVAFCKVFELSASNWLTVFDNK